MNKKMQGKIRELHTAFKTVKEIADELKIDGAEEDISAHSERAG